MGGIAARCSAGCLPVFCTPSFLADMMQYEWHSRVSNIKMCLTSRHNSEKMLKEGAVI
jgi:hypothetical protein